MRCRQFGVLAVAGGLGCAVGQPTALRTLDPDLAVGKMGNRTAFEGPASAAQTAAPDQPQRDHVANDRDQRALRGVFIAGAVLAGVGGGTTLAFGIAGRVVQFQLKKAYEDGVTRAHESYLRRHGAAYNKVAIAGASIGTAGVLMMIVAAGLDYTRCGDLIVKKREGCKPG